MIVLTKYTYPEGENRELCELTKKTIKVGFPTAKIFECVDEELTHFDWITQMLGSHIFTDEPLVFCDSDMIFYENVEDHFPNDLFAGHLIPGHLSTAVDNMYHVPRLHSSLFYIRSPKELILKIAEHQNPVRTSELAAYMPEDLVAPTTTWIWGRPYFYDTLAMLCHALDDHCHAYNEKFLQRYAHVGCGSCANRILPLLDPPERARFQAVRQMALSEPERLRGLYRETEVYYQHRSIALYDYAVSGKRPYARPLHPGVQDNNRTVPET